MTSHADSEHAAAAAEESARILEKQQAQGIEAEELIKHLQSELELYRNDAARLTEHVVLTLNA